MNLSEIIKSEYNKSISECTNEEIYNALLTLVKTMAEGKQHKNSKKKLYYISAEFLIGKLLSNNLINLGIYDDIKEELAKNGKDLCEIEEFEKEPSLGNGGLGRLAACFLDSIATLGLNGDGVGLNYHLDYSDRYLRIMHRLQFQIHGLQKKLAYKDWCNIYS